MLMCDICCRSRDGPPARGHAAVRLHTAHVRRAGAMVRAARAGARGGAPRRARARPALPRHAVPVRHGPAGAGQPAGRDRRARVRERRAGTTRARRQGARQRESLFIHMSTDWKTDKRLYYRKLNVFGNFVFIVFL